MSGDYRTKINQKLLAAPMGAVLTLRWLKEKGISAKLANHYASSGWLHRVGSGAFTTTPEPPSWLGVVYGLQQKPGCTVHPGGRTALEIAGRSHFLSLGESTTHLFGAKNERLPSWALHAFLSQKLKYTTTNFLPATVGLQEYRAGSFTIQVSGEERAILEFLYEQEVDEPGYEHMRLIFESLGTLRVPVLQKLLEGCTSVKVKRLFLHLAEVQAHTWFKLLDFSKISLGAGKRVLVKGGRLDKKYLITVPVIQEIPSDAP